jgi:hypothetical protein
MSVKGIGDVEVVCNKARQPVTGKISSSRSFSADRDIGTTIPRLVVDTINSRVSLR